MYEVLTRRGRVLTEIVQQGTKGQQDAIAMSEKLGLTFSAADQAASRSAQLAEKDAQLAVNSIRQSFANGVAALFFPLRQAWAEAVSGAVEYAQPVLLFFRNGLAGAGALVKYVIEGITAEFRYWQPLLSEMADQLQLAWTELSDALGTTGDWRDTLHLVGRLIADIIVPALAFTIGILTEIAQRATLAVRVYSQMAQVLKSEVLFVIQRIGDAILLDLNILGRLPGKLGAPFRAAAAEAKKDLQLIQDGIDGLKFGLPGLPEMGKAAAELEFDDGKAKKEHKAEEPKALAAGSQAALETINRSQGADDPNRSLIQETRAGNAILSAIRQALDRANNRPGEIPQVVAL